MVEHNNYCSAIIRTISNDLENGKSKKSQEGNDGADFETAISATGFGRFNVLLLLVAIPSGWASVFETTSVSYVMPIAHCDLDMSLEQKGLLNAITYLGMMSSAIMWGFLADTLGRKRLLVAGFLMDAFFVFLAGFSQSFPMLAVAKYFGGFIINGPFAVLTSTLSEFHCAQYRARVVLLLGVVFMGGTILMPALAWLVMPMGSLEYSAFDGNFQIHSWNVYIFLCGVPSFVSAVCHLFLPESPKFLMTCGENEKALGVFQYVYSLNSGQPAHTFPIKKLIDETQLHADDPNYCHVTAHRSKLQALKEGWQQLVPLFRPPLIMRLVMICVIQMGQMMGLNTLRLWLPQIFQAINDFQKQVNVTEDANLCNMLSTLTPRNSTNIECVVNYDNESVYVNSMIVASSTIIGYVITGFLINKVGKKAIICGSSMIGGICAFSLYFAINDDMTTALTAIFNGCISINTNVVLAVVVDLFPTTLRTMTVSVTMMFGRSGALTGNVIFPYLIGLGCLPPFLYIGSSVVICGLIAVMLPKTDLKALE